MKRKGIFFATLLLSIFLLSACETGEKKPEKTLKRNPECTVEQIDFPFGKWEISAPDVKCFDYFGEGYYSVFLGRKSGELYQYTVYTYDMTDETWTQEEFSGNSQLKKANVNLIGNYQKDADGNIYFLGQECAKDSKQAIYQIRSDGQLTKLDGENKLISAQGEVTSFLLTEDGKFLVAVEEDEETEIRCIDFGKGETKKTKLPADIDTSISLYSLCVLEDQFVYLYRLNDTTYAMQFRKFMENIPEKMVTIDCEFEMEESLYSWNIGKTVDGSAYMMSSKGIFKVEGDAAKQIVGESEVAPIFDEYEDVIYTAQYDEDNYYCVVQNENEISLFRITVQ